MRHSISFVSFLAALAAVLAVGCGGGGGHGTTQQDPTPHVAYTVNGAAESMDQGLAEAGGVPHAEVYAGPTLAVFAASTACTRSGPAPQLGVVLFVEGGSTGTFPGHLFQQDGAGGADTHAEAVDVTVTRLDPDGGLVEASFHGASVDGELVARRDDAVGFFAR